MEPREPILKPTSEPWPPRPLPDAPADRRGVDWTAPARLASASAGSLDLPEVDVSWWGQIERAWLGLSVPPFAERAAMCGWRADAPGEACSRCGSSVGSFEADEDGCPECRDRRLPWSRCVRLGMYDGLLRRAICEVKFTSWRRLGREIGRLLGARLAEAMEREGVSPERTVIVPVPTPFWRRMSRGIDHTWCIARGVRDVTGARVVGGLARRGGRPQHTLPRSQRAANVRGSMRAKGVDLSGVTAIVLDDVRTTGATMLEACRALRRMDERRRPSQVWSAVVGVTPDERRRRDLKWREEEGEGQDLE